MFTAEFFDAADHRASQQVALSLHCDGGPACEGQCQAELCGGTCLEVSTFDSDPDNCGTCGNVCAFGECDRGECSDCEPSSAGMQFECDPICQSGCQADEACVQASTAGILFACGTPGPLGLNQTCAMLNECGEGLFCVATSDDPNAPNPKCLQACDADGANTCPAGQICVSVGFTDLGVCDPGR